MTFRFWVMGYFLSSRKLCFALRKQRSRIDVSNLESERATPDYHAPMISTFNTTRNRPIVDSPLIRDSRIRRIASGIGSHASSRRTRRRMGAKIDTGLVIVSFVRTGSSFGAARRVDVPRRRQRIDKFPRQWCHARACARNRGRRARIQFEINARRKTHCSHGIVQINRSISRTRRN